MKKRGFGAGKWNGYGGKVEEGEDPIAAASRELFEESGLIVQKNKLQQVALVRFYMEEDFVFECSVFITKNWHGTLIETEEMAPRWYTTKTLPFEEMWKADAKWIPLVLKGEQIEAEVKFNADGWVMDYDNRKI